jgi:hypothetical protein
VTDFVGQATARWDSAYEAMRDRLALGGRR